MKGSLNYVDNHLPAPGIPYRGGIVDAIANNQFRDLHRPYIDRNGRPSLTMNLGRTTLVKGEQVPIKEHVLIRDFVNNSGVNLPVLNATALRKEEWTYLDQQVVKAARYRLGAWTDLAKSNTFGGFNGMGKMILEHETMSDPGEAMVDMDVTTPARTDAPTFQLEGLPLPVTHSDFFYGARRLGISRSSSTPLDAVSAEAAARRVAESVEKTTIGVSTGITYGGNSTQVGGYGRTSSVYGYLNFPNRITKTNLTVPTGSNASATVADVLAMRQLLYNAKFFGPYTIYHSNDWDTFMDGDYILTGGNVATQTLRNRLKSIPDVQDVKRLDFLFASQPDSTKGPGGENLTSLKPFTLVMVQMTSEVARAVVGLDVTVVQWETIGGLQLNFKVMCICVPQLRADRYGNCGICHATTS